MPGGHETERAIAGVPLWYHTIDLPSGITTPGWFDLRPIVESMPWPDVEGKRCLDLGPYDGFLSFELERRGAASVVAADIAGPEHWDWPPAFRTRGIEFLRATAGETYGAGFEVARQALGSKVDRIELSAYDLAPETCGKFDVVVCGDLLLHLRDPLRALAAVRGVCDGFFMSCEEINAGLTIAHPRKPTMLLRGDDQCQWTIPNVAAHKRMLEASGFGVISSPRPYAIAYGPSHPPPGANIGNRLRRAGCKLLTGKDGVPQHACLTKPAEL